MSGKKLKDMPIFNVAKERKIFPIDFGGTIGPITFVQRMFVYVNDISIRP